VGKNIKLIGCLEVGEERLGIGESLLGERKFSRQDVSWFSEIGFWAGGGGGGVGCFRGEGGMVLREFKGVTFLVLLLGACLEIVEGSTKGTRGGGGYWLGGEEEGSMHVFNQLLSARGGASG